MNLHKHPGLDNLPKPTRNLERSFQNILPGFPTQAECVDLCFVPRCNQQGPLGSPNHSRDGSLGTNSITVVCIYIYMWMEPLGTLKDARPRSE